MQPFDAQKIQSRIDRLLHGLNTQYMMIPSCVDKVVKYAHSGKHYYLNLDLFGYNRYQDIRA